jgi:hypothetical protein
MYVFARVSVCTYAHVWYRSHIHVFLYSFSVNPQSIYVTAERHRTRHYDYHELDDMC